MKLFIKILLGFVGLIIILVIAGLIYLETAFPKVKKAPELTINATPDMIARGEYLAKHVAICMDCHSTRDWGYFAGPIMPGTLGKGGDLFDETIGLPGKLYAKNITPYNLKNWTDGEIYRVITTGVDKKGEPLFPFMPYLNYAGMDPEDVKAIIAYIRTLSPIMNDVPEHDLKFPMNLITRIIPHDVETPGKRPPECDTLAYGKYLTTIAACDACHTPLEKGKPIMSKMYAGGMEFNIPGLGIIRSANITPDINTGIGNWTEEQFIMRFKLYDKPEDSYSKYQKGTFNTIMPVYMYAGMKEEDLRAIYKYLRTVKPVNNQVITYTVEK